MKKIAHYTAASIVLRFTRRRCRALTFAIARLSCYYWQRSSNCDSSTNCFL